MKINMFASLIAAAMIAAPAMAVDAGFEQVASNTKPEKITNRQDPDYVRCRSEPIIGSLAKKRRICMTNREWAEVGRQGSDTSRQLIEDMRAGGTNSAN